MREKQVDIWIPGSFYKTIITEADKFHPIETGGVFMGYEGSNGDLVVTNLVSCGVNAIHRNNSFEPDQDYQIKEIEKIFNDSDGNIIYLGDWHTHPNGYNELSYKDKKTLFRIASVPSSQISHPVMAVLGQNKNGWEMNAVRFISGKVCFWSYVSCKYQKLKVNYF